jgi:hypothetical protein
VCRSNDYPLLLIIYNLLFFLRLLVAKKGPK